MFEVMVVQSLHDGRTLWANRLMPTHRDPQEFLAELVKEGQKRVRTGAVTVFSVMPSRMTGHYPIEGYIEDSEVLR